MNPLLFLFALLKLATSVRLNSKSQTDLNIDQAIAVDEAPLNQLVDPALQSVSFGIRAPPGSNALMRFTDGSLGSVVLVLESDTGRFILKNEQISLMEFDQRGEEVIMGVSKLRAKSIQYYGDILYRDIPQWKLAVNENFWQEPDGWTINSISTCGGINMLGGFSITAGGENSKTFRDLPPHQKLRITATFHFIDAWTGESAYMKVNIGREHAAEYVWTERYDSTQAVNTIDVCGAHYGEGKFSSPIDITIPHVEDSIAITFGTTLDQDPQDESWGLSNLSIYII